MLRRSLTHPFLPTLHQRLQRHNECFANLTRALRRDPDLLQHPQHVVRDEPSAPTRPPTGKHIPHRLRLAPVAFEGVVPLYWVRALSEIFLVEDLEPDGLERRKRGGDGAHLRDAVSQLDAVCKVFV